nr:uncharacterized protein LOC119179984 [Rhipicephalus microplus]
MAPSVRVLLVLAHLAVMVVGKHGSGRVQDKYQSDRCKKLMRMIMWCGSEKDWKNEIQRKMAAHMGGSNFTDEVDECLAASLDPDDRMSYCTDIKSLRVYLMCSRQTLFNRVHIGSKFAALMFHRGFEHCVKVNMGMMEADLGMSNDEETGPSDDDDDDEYYKKLDRPKKPQRRQPAVYDEDRHDHHNHRDEQGGHYARMVRKQDHRKQTRPFHKDLRHKRRPLHDDGINRHEGRVRKNRNKWHNDRETNGRDKRPHEVFGVQRRGQHRRPLGDRDMMNRHDRH